MTRSRTAWTLALVLFAPCAAAEESGVVEASSPAISDDPYLWLEDVTGKRTLDWVEEQNVRSRRALMENGTYEAIERRFVEILDSDDKIAYVEKIGELYYNFWNDKDHLRGIWRRTTLEEYRKDHPAWETVIDLDALSAAENEHWSWPLWAAAVPLPPDYTRCIISLSRGGSDAIVAREFDLASKTFVTDGFSLPEAKSTLFWRSRDTVYVGTDFGPGSMTSSGYPRVFKTWTRGTPLAAARELYACEPEDVYAYVWHDFTPGYERDLAYRVIDSYTTEVFLLDGVERVKIEKPVDAEATPFREWLLLKLRSDWQLPSRTWPAGSLLAIRFEDFLEGDRAFESLFAPTERTSLITFVLTSDHVVLNVLDNVRSRLYAARHDGKRWTSWRIPGLPDLGSMEVFAVDPLASDDYLVKASDLLTPTTLYMGAARGAPPEALKRSPAFFDASGLVASQHEALSKDGTRVPYFEVAPKSLKLDGAAPTLLSGYGGFEIPSLPTYSALVGSGWCERGGVYVLANIRGGSEFGPKWHQAALRANRPRAYEDFIAVAEDLVRRKVTSSRFLGCEGASNGGLLVGNMLTMRPDLFGAILCESPLLDMKRYAGLLAGASWMGEYGNPSKPEEWAFIRTFSPYHNVKADGAYPPTLFTSSTRDDRVHPGHARKMAALMEAQGHDVLYYENTEGGHNAVTDNVQVARIFAIGYSFLWKHLRGNAP